MKKVIRLFILCLLLVSCTSSPIQTIESGIATNTPIATEDITKTPFITESAAPTAVRDLSDCLSPLEDFKYQIGDAPSDFERSGVNNNSAMPSQEWQKTINVPDASRLMLIQSRNNETIFWIDLHSGGYVRYRVSGDKWDEGTLLPGPNDDLRGFPLTLDRENNVFGASYYQLNRGDARAPLNRYNEQTDQWEPVTIDLANQDKLRILHVEVDDQGVFWLLMTDGAEIQLHSFDPNTKITQRHLIEYVLYSETFTISHNILFTIAESNDPAPRHLLLQYSLDSGEVMADYIGTPLYLDYQRIYETLPNTIYVDNQQRVWIGARGWLDLPTDEWYYVIPNPVFITVLPGAGKWVWGEPTITSETPDGRLWYNALRGTGWVDPKLGKWCVFTSYQSNVLADSQGNLWILVDGWLYRRG